MKFEGGVGQEDPDGEGGEGVDVDVFCGDAIREGGVGGRDGFFVGSRGDAERASVLEGVLDSGMQPVLEKKFEEDAVELYSDARHCFPSSTLSLSLSISLYPSISLLCLMLSFCFLGLVCFIVGFGREEGNIFEGVLISLSLPMHEGIDLGLGGKRRGEGKGNGFNSMACGG